MSVSTETAWPFTVVTEILPVVAPEAAISLTLKVMVEAVDPEGSTVLFLQNFTVKPEAPNPLPLIVKVPPVLS